MPRGDYLVYFRFYYEFFLKSFGLKSFCPQILSSGKQDKILAWNPDLFFWAEIICPEMQFRPPNILPHMSLKFAPCGCPFRNLMHSYASQNQLTETIRPTFSWYVRFQLGGLISLLPGMKMRAIFSCMPLGRKTTSINSFLAYSTLQERTRISKWLRFVQSNRLV